MKSRPASQAIIDDQITVLNNTFSGGEGRVDTGFRFTLAGVDRTVNLDWYNAKINGAERAMKRALHTGGPETLNQCYTEFTAGQAARMQDAWITFRAS